MWVHLLGGGTLDTTLPDGRRINLKQETDYPWDGTVKLTVESAPAGEVSLFVRVPGWADGATLATTISAVAAGRAVFPYAASVSEQPVERYELTRAPAA